MQLPKFFSKALVIGVPATLFAVALALAYIRPPIALDTEIPLWLHTHATFLDGFMNFLNQAGDVGLLMPVFLLLAVAFLLFRRWRTAIFVGAAGLFAGLVNIGLKVLVQRPRPELWPMETDSTYSFPSGHMLLSGTLILAIVALTWRTKWRWPVAVAGSVLILFMGVSRMYLGEHYPSDVLGSLCIAILLVLGGKWLILDRKKQS